MAGHDLIAMGGSAGSVEALLRLVPHLPRDLGAAVLLTLHLPADSPSNLPRILSARGPLPARAARNGEQATPGVIHVARPDRHLELVDGKLQLTRGPRENGYRPAVDTLFRSVARARGPRAVGVVLSGALDDGAAGLLAVKRAGGLAVVQDPKDALYPSMPRSALREVGADHVVPADAIGPLLAQLTSVEPAASLAAELEPERVGSPFSCPDCGGVLDFLPGGPLRLRCQVGHGWTARSLVQGQSDDLEYALWAAYRALVEHARLLHAMADRARQRGNPKSAVRYAERSLASRERARLVRNALGVGPPPAEQMPTEDEFATAGEVPVASPGPRSGNGAPEG